MMGQDWSFNAQRQTQMERQIEKDAWTEKLKKYRQVEESVQLGNRSRLEREHWQTDAQTN